MNKGAVFARQRNHYWPIGQEDILLKAGASAKSVPGELDLLISANDDHIRVMRGVCAAKSSLCSPQLRPPDLQSLTNGKRTEGFRARLVTGRIFGTSPT